MASAAPAAAPARTASGRAAAPDGSTLVDLAQQVRSWTDSVLGVAGAAADVTLGAAKMMLPKPGQRAALEKTGAVLRRMRETAGMSVDEVGNAIDLKDPTLLELVENGKVALPFEIILRLASVLGRNDPISFVMRFTRSYNPDVWKTLESLGIGRLALQAGREREFANIYRGERRRAPSVRRGIRRGAEVHAGRVRDGARVPRRQSGAARRGAAGRRRKRARLRPLAARQSRLDVVEAGHDSVIASTT